MTPQDGGRYAFMQPDIALAAADETHRRGLPVLAHPTDIEGINLAIEAGVDVLVHTTIGEGKTVWEPALVEQLIAQEHGAHTDAAALPLRVEAGQARASGSSSWRRAMPSSSCACSRRRAARCSSAPTSAT